MRTWLTRYYEQYFLPRYVYRIPIEQQRAQILMLVSFVGLLLLAIIVTFLTFVTLVQSNPLSVALFGPPLLSVPFALTMYFGARDGRLNWAITAYMTSLIVTALPVVALVPNSPILLIMLPLLGAGVVLGRRGILLTALVVALTFGWRFQSELRNRTPQRIIPAQQAASELGANATVIALGTVLLVLFGGSTARTAELSTRYTRHLNATLKLLSHADVDETGLIVEALRMMQVELGYTAAFYYTIDETGAVTGRASLTPAALADASLLGEAALNRERDPETEPAVEASLTGTRVITTRDGGTFAAHLVPVASAALLAPVRDAQRVTGIFSIQTQDQRGFTPDIRGAFDSLARMIGNEMSRVRDATQNQQRANEQERELLRARAQIRARVGGGGLIEKLNSRAVMGYNVISETAAQNAATAGILGLKSQPAYDLPPDIRQTLERGEVHVEQRDNGEQQLSIPISVRGEVLGAMSFMLSSERPVTTRQLDLVRTVADRLALSLENSQLFEQTQAQADREHKASEIASQLLTATDIDVLLNVAVSNFREALGAVYTGVFIAPDLMDEPRVQALPANGSTRIAGKRTHDAGGTA